MDGCLVRFDTASQRRRLDDFEGELYKITTTVVSVRDSEGELTGETVEADMYLWDGDDELLSEDGWELETFVNERLEDWLDLLMGWR